MITLPPGPDQNSVSSGMVCCDPSYPIPITARFQARIVLFNIDMPITKGNKNLNKTFQSLTSAVSQNYRLYFEGSKDQEQGSRDQY